MVVFAMKSTYQDYLVMFFLKVPLCVLGGVKMSFSTISINNYSCLFLIGVVLLKFEKKIKKS